MLFFFFCYFRKHLSKGGYSSLLIMKVPKEDSKEQNNDNTLNDDDNLSNPYDTESNSDSIDPPTRDGDFSEYMWMENQEEFDLQVHT